MDKTRNTLNRRTLIGAAGATAALAMSPRGLRAGNRSPVLVIGAGLSGLNAALTLQEAGMNVRVIEGRDRVGGRVLSHRNVPGNPESGGTAFGPGYARLVTAANTHGVGLVDLTPTIPFFFRRELFLGGEHVPAQAWPAHPQNSFPEPMKKIMPWAFLTATIGPKNPLTTNDAWVDPAHATLDISLHDWLASLGVSEESIHIGYDINPGWGSSAKDVSALMILCAARFAQTQQELAKGKAAGYTAKGGNQSIPEAMAAALKNPVELNRNVVAIRAEKDGIEARCADGTKYQANHVICSIPTAVLRRIKIEPALTGVQAKAVQQLGVQSITQVHIVPRAKFWEKDGMHPAMCTDGLVNMLVDEHKGDNPADTTSLTVWLRGQSALRTDKMSEKDAVAAVVKEIERLRPAAKGQLEVAAYHSWMQDSFSRGDWAVWQPGQITAFVKDIGKAHGRIHFCGEHTAVSNRGMEGAMESGERAALEVAQAS